MTEVRKIPQPDGGRVETGPVQFGDDWPGLFIRGDNAAYLATCIQSALSGDTSNPYAVGELRSIADAIFSGVIVKPNDAMVELRDQAIDEFRRGECEPM